MTFDFSPFNLSYKHAEEAVPHTLTFIIPKLMWKYAMVVYSQNMFLDTISPIFFSHKAILTSR